MVITIKSSSLDEVPDDPQDVEDDEDDLAGFHILGLVVGGPPDGRPPWLDLSVVRETIELGCTRHPAPVAGLGTPDHIRAETVAENIVRGNLFKVVHKVNGLDVGHLGKNLPIGMGLGDSLTVLVGAAVSQLGTHLDDGVGGEVPAIDSLSLKDVKDLLDHPVGLSGLGGLEGGVGPGRTGRGLEPDSVILFHGVGVLFVLLIFPFPITKIQKRFETTKFF